MTRSRRLSGALLVLALTTGVQVPSVDARAVPRGEEAPHAVVPARERSATGPVPVRGDAWVVLRGHGWGHGHGMSQYGAGGAAAAGRTWEQILAFYYPGTQRGSATGEVRVLLGADTTPDLVVRHQQGLQLLDGGRSLTLPDGTTDLWRLVGTATGHALQRRTTVGGEPRWRRELLVGPGAGFSAGGAPVVLVTPVGESAYRGRLVRTPAGTVNTLPLEDYVRGVVTREMPASWPAHAVAAQAVAARTYAVRGRAGAAARSYDVCDTTSCQVYGGVAGESATGDAAVLATAGTVLLHGGAPALTMYSSSNGGRALSAGLPYLVDQRDPWDDWAPNPNHTWLRRVADTRLESLRPGIGDLRAVEVVGREGGGEWGGRVTALRLTGTAGAATVPGEELKARLGLKERWFALVGARRR